VRAHRDTIMSERCAPRDTAHSGATPLRTGRGDRGEVGTQIPRAASGVEPSLGFPSGKGYR
jgi:hypothetical protein